MRLIPALIADDHFFNRAAFRLVAAREELPMVYDGVESLGKVAMKVFRVYGNAQIRRDGIVRKIM